jgi:ATP-binding cassette, subfamily F, member 3
MLKSNQITKSYGREPVLSAVSFSLGPGERAGLVGPNGSGKTTLLRILAGAEQPEAGTVLYTPASLRLGYLAQGLEFRESETIADYLARIQGDVPALSAELEQLAAALADNPNQAELQSDYDATLGLLSSAANTPGAIAPTLAALGLGHLPVETPVATLSGGQKTRLALAGVLLTDPQLLLLDEPTNHLDLGMLEWLERWLSAYAGVVVIVSHDRAFLDGTVNKILELDPATHGLRAYAGNYSDYLEQKLAEGEQARQAYSDQQQEIGRLRNTARQLRGLAKLRRGGKADDGDKFAKGFFGNRSAATVGRAKQIERRMQDLMTREHLDKPQAGWQMKLAFGETPASGQDVLALEDVAIGYGEATLARGLNAHILNGARVALIGSNGAGKTTLVRTIAGRLPPVEGQVRLGANVRVGYMAQEQELLDPALNALTTVRGLASLTETNARAFLHYFLFTGDDVFVPVGALSFGERARLSLASLVVQGCNFLLLDEPINHLDIPSRARFEQALAAFEGTILAVVHDRFFIAGFASEIWKLEAGRLDSEPA